ncbi:MAG TPA: kelch repeat-containing protein [Kofleriaceae bacterium]|nr:kelch repeat-containing protein [Kofleriaceae bacterium]
MRSALLACLLVGCIHDDLVHCADGNACPVGLVCDPAHHSCATQEQIDACTALPDLAACLTDSTCHEGVCLPNGCGNGRTDPPEACDDGNTMSGDGCASDCSSNEICGNGITDLVQLETCDDGNRRSHDGCDSLCNVEQPRWRQLRPMLPPSMYEHVAAFDPVRRRVVVFGGTIGGIETQRTLEYSIDTATWFDVSPTISPPARVLASMAYDAARGEMVLFGGYAQGSLFFDTWLWNGRTWTQVATPVGPSARYNASMAYDSRRKKIVLFGGSPSTATTWEWDGAWHAVDVPDAPPSRYAAPMAYDPRRAEIVMTGGLDMSSAAINDGTWLWDGTAWRHSASSPGARYHVPMVFDAKHDGVLVVGPIGTTFIWDGQSWTQLGVSSTFFDGLHYFAMFYDPLRETVMTYGGSNTSSSGPTGAMYRWTTTNNAWVGFAPTPIPALTSYAGMTYDGSRHEPVRFGGFDAATGDTNTTLDLVDDAWVLRAASNPPGSRINPQLVFDTTLGRLLMFGGDQGDPGTYEFANNAWTTIASGAPTLVGGAAIYDPDDHVAMHFGGSDLTPGSPPVADTYVFDGSWHQVTGPSAIRRAHVLVYDESAKHAVMVTGSSGSAPTPQDPDTWLWTSSQGWSQVLPMSVPSHRVRAAATYDPLRHEVVLFGGQAATLYLADTWSWNETSWTQLDIEVTPAASDRSCMTYDRQHERAVLENDAGTYVLQWTSVIRDEVCQVGFDRDGDGLVGCDDPDCADICASCGDAVCGTAETCRNCPGDCGVCTPLCGDTYCDGEAQSCPGDCP